MRNILVALFLALGVAACTQTLPAGPAGQASADPLGDIAKFTIADLQAADADAVAHNDVLSHACYPALIKFVGELQTQGSNLTVSGAFSAFQKARDLRRSVQGGIPDYLKLGCAPLVQDEVTLLVKLGAIGAGSSVLGPLAPALVP